MSTRVFIVVLAVILPLAALTVTFAGEPSSGRPNLVVNGDFEQASHVQSAARMDHVGRREVQGPRPLHPGHGPAAQRRGRVSVSIIRPARPATWFLPPNAAIRPKPGMMYSVSFWARTDRPGEAMFGWDAYRQIRPFVEAPRRACSHCRSERQWKEFRFVLHEGWDFFADECRYLMLLFKAAGRAEEERTLWIDDVVVTERPSPRKPTASSIRRP